MRGARSSPAKTLGNFIIRMIRAGVSHTLSSVPYMIIAWIIATAVIVQLLFFQHSHEKKVWEKCRRDFEAKGEHLDLQDFVPPAVPDDQNFAMTPLLAPLIDITKDADGKFGPRDTNAVARLDQLFVWAGSPCGGDWQRMQFADLECWETWFRGITNELDDSSLEQPIALTNTAFADGRTNAAQTPFPFELSNYERSRRHALRTNAIVAARLATTPPSSAAEDLLALANMNAAELNEIRAALRRPNSNFNVHYEQGVEVSVFHLGPLKKFALTFRDKAIADLAANDAAAALDDVLAGLDLADTLKGEPTVLSTKTRMAIAEITLQPIWEGLARRQWKVAQIAMIQSHLERMNFIEGMALSLRGNRAVELAKMDSMRRQVPRIFTFADGFIYDQKTTFTKWYQQYVLPPYDPTNRLLNVRLSQKLAEEFKDEHSEHNPFNAFAHPMLLWSLNDADPGRPVRTQASVNLAAVACALERFRFAHGAYPERLDQLAPDFIKSLPTDPVNGQPLKYKRTDRGRFLLYSVWFDLIDDGGARPEPHREGTILSHKVEAPGTGHIKLDLVWSYPEK
jgi:hypothetical protein